MSGPIDKAALLRVQAVSRVHGDTVSAIIDAKAAAISIKNGGNGDYTLEQLFIAINEYFKNQRCSDCYELHKGPCRP
jgi:PHP family Zn ribbon phosphoesterase